VREPTERIGEEDPPASSDAPRSTDPVQAGLLESRSFEPGDCVAWESSKGTADTDVVDCDTPHLFQVAGSIDLREVEGIGRDYPDDGAWQVVTDRDCGPLVTDHLGVPLDPNGRWALGIIHPTQQGWSVGDRTAWCGIQANDVDGQAAGDSLLPMTGRFDPTMQTLPLPTGQCRAFQPDGDTTPVGCDEPHQLEVVGTVSIPDAPSFPGDAALDAACLDLAEAYSERDFFYGPYRFDERSWAAGSRQVVCVIGVDGDVFGWGTRSGSLASGG
jgi:hypothetical protein